MIQVAICDDEKILQEEVCSILNKYARTSNTDMQIKCFADGEHLVASPMEFDLYFLDYLMVGLNGLETAKRLRNRKIKSPIVFLTNYREAMQDAFEVKTYLYIFKNNMKNELIRCMDNFILDYCICNQVKLNNSYGCIILPSRKIYYITAAHNGTEIWTTKGMCTSIFSLSEWSKRLDKSIFYRCHKKSIVNLAYIAKVGDFIELSDGERVEISRRNKKGLYDLLDRYVSKYAR